MAWKGDRKSILLEPNTLSEEYTPNNIHGRENQINFFRSCLSPVLRNEKPMHIWLHGKPGTGKTVTAKSLVYEIHDKARVGFVYVNCRRHNSFYSILDEILNELRVGFGNERNGRIKLEKLGRYIKDRPMLIILDEIDFIPQKERSSLLYNLSFGKVGLVCISENREAVLSLNGRTKSRIQPHIIEFKAYSPKEIIEILSQRAVEALDPCSWDKNTLEKIAGLAEGDARAAIQTLRSAAEFADVQGSQSINTDHIGRAFSDTKAIKKSYTLKRLGEHCKILYSLIEGAGRGFLSTALWELYLKECSKKGFEPVAKRTYSYYLNKMTQLKLIEAKRARIRGHVYEFEVRDGK